MHYQKGRGRLIFFAAAAITFCGTAALALPVRHGPGSLAGYWVNTGPTTLAVGRTQAGFPSFRTSSGQLIPLLPSVAKIVAERRSRQDDKPFPPACLTEGMPAVAAPHRQNPIEIIEQSAQTTILLEYFGNFRTIRMNSDHLEDPDPTYMGDSTARWENGTLTIDTVAVTDKTNILGLIPHSDQLHIVERMRRTGPDTMESRITIEDPKILSKPWSMVSRFASVAIHNLSDFPCGTGK